MDETEWLACTDVGSMLDFLRLETTERKLLLYVCDCFRRVVGDRPDRRCRRALAVVEGYADGTIDRGRLVRLANTAWRLGGPTRQLFSDGIGSTGDFWTDDFGRRHAAWQTGSALVVSLTRRRRPGRQSQQAAETLERQKAQLLAALRCVVGNPFCIVPIRRSWLKWNDGTVAKMARAIYDERAFDRVPVLGDALEEAGCNHPDILSHCRAGGPHVRGCWVVDLLLRQE